MHTRQSLFPANISQPKSICGESVIMLAVSPVKRNLFFLQRMFDDANWKLFTAHTYKEAMAQLSRELFPVVICEAQLPDGNWKDMLNQLALISDSPRLIVASRYADERLWSEVLNLGGFDLLATPFQEVEVGYTIGSAWLDWKDERSSGPWLDGHDDQVTS
jgi:DNA-binding response OmpR family regulator